MLLLAHAATFSPPQPSRSIKVTMGGPDIANAGMRQITIRRAA